MKLKFYWIIIALTCIGAFLRFYRLPETLQFLGDQGRDALIVRRLLVEHDPVFIGPVTSVGNMYLGPAYYYFMLPFYALTYPSPMGPVYAVALLGTLTIPLMYQVGKELIGKRAALISTIVFTFGWVFILNTRFSWNPNPAPFVSLVMIWATYRAWKKNSWYWVIVSVCFSILIQLHYMTLLTLPTAGIFWLWSLVEILRKEKKRLKPFLLSTFLSIVIFLLSLTPLVLFDFKHDFLNARALNDIFFGKEDQVRSQTEFFRTLQETFGRSHQILFEITTSKLRWLNSSMIIVVFAVLAFTLKQKESVFKSGQIIVIIWLAMGVVGTSLYKSTVFDHYIAYLFPVTCLILGIVLSTFWQWKLGKAIVVMFFGWFFITNFLRYDYRSVGWRMSDMQNYAEQISQFVSPGEKYSLVGVNSYNDIYAMNYRYFLTTMGKQPLETEDANSAEKLLIVNETEDSLQQILDLPIYEIVIFPDKDQRQVITFPEGPDLIILRR
jgi:4-amino-4-deoxy-L-arabinose transferase-like glycosyltransferase